MGKTTRGGIIKEKKYATNAFLWEILALLVYIFNKTIYFIGFHINIIRDDFSKKTTLPVLFL